MGPCIVDFEDVLDGLPGRFAGVAETSSSCGSSTAVSGTCVLSFSLTVSRSRLSLASRVSFCENMRLNREVKVGFFCGVGRGSRASPFGTGVADGDGPVAGPPSLFCVEFTDAEDEVGAGESVVPFCEGAGAGRDSDAVTAIAIAFPASGADNARRRL